ncbi:MAG: hypothetical protein H0U16_01735 [Actinobacteria bacterium]|nr:hypothetical protein [Actinomycetota bacterium]
MGTAYTKRAWHSDNHFSLNQELTVLRNDNKVRVFACVLLIRDHPLFASKHVL